VELADIVRRHGPAYRQQHSLSGQQQRVLAAIERCRTAALGGHVEQCDPCSQLRISYNSCGNRHCPKRQSLARARWLQARQRELLPVPYFHVVFTVPPEVAAIGFQNATLFYSLLFRAASQTLLTIAADPKHLGAQIGFWMILHTGASNLLYHPHLHCVVPGGGLSPDQQHWVHSRPHFLAPVRVLSRLFRRRLLTALQQAFDRGQLRFRGDLAPLAERRAFYRYLVPLRRRPWVVYAKPPFGGPTQVLEYLGRYTHRVALSHDRLLADDEGQVRFRWKDYRDPGRWKVLTLAAEEFLRRFLLHVLPRGFHRIRSYGWLANRWRTPKLALCRQLLAVAATLLPPLPPSGRDLLAKLTGQPADRCPACGRGRMRLVEVLPPARSPPGTAR
jgi:hypothetical protein